MTGADGRVKEGPFDTPIPLEPGAKAVVQGYGIHRARNAGEEEAEVWSMRVLAADKPAFALIGLREFAKTFVNLDGGNNATVLNVVPRFPPYDDRQKEFVNDIRELIVPSFAGLGEHETFVGGTTAQFMDFSDKLYDRFPYRDRRRAAAHVHRPDDVLPVGLPAAEGDPDEPRLDPRDLRCARPDLPARLGLETCSGSTRWARSAWSRRRSCS